MNLHHAKIRDLINFTDQQGVLTFTVGHTPSQAADPQPTAPIEVRNQIRSLLTNLRESDASLASAVEQRIEQLTPQIDHLVDPTSSGRGRALFAAVGSDRTETVTLQIPLPDRVVHDTAAYVRPLVAALDEGRPSGVLVVSSQRTRLLRWALGEAEELVEQEFELSDDVVAQQKAGPAMTNPARAQQGFMDRDRFLDRVDENRHRFFRAVAEDVLARAKEEDWDRVVLSAPPKTREVMHSVLEVNGGPEIIVPDVAWEDSAPHHIAEQMWDVLRTTRREREQTLVDSVLERALGGGAGALGVPAVCAALNEGRVARLLYDAELDLEGYVTEEGTLHASADEVEGAHPDGLFVERLLEKAITTSAAVTPLAPDTAAPLGPYDRVAALLRW